MPQSKRPHGFFTLYLAAASLQWPFGPCSFFDKVLHAAVLSLCRLAQLKSSFISRSMQVFRVSPSSGRTELAPFWQELSPSWWYRATGQYEIHVIRDEDLGWEILCLDSGLPASRPVFRTDLTQAFNLASNLFAQYDRLASYTEPRNG